MARARIPHDAITAWAQAQSLPRWLLPLVALVCALLIAGALSVLLRVERLSVRAVPDADAGSAAPAHALPSEVRILQAAWAIVRMVDEWRSAGLAGRFAEAAPFIAPRIRSDIKEHFQSLLRGGVADVRPAKAIVALAARILARDPGTVTVALAYDAIDLVESERGRMSVAHDEVAVMVLTLEADVATEENPYGLLATAIERERGEDRQDRFWAADGGRRGGAMNRHGAWTQQRMAALAPAAALLIASLLIGAAVAITARMPTIRVAGTAGERIIRPEDYGRRQVEAAARRWLLGWANSNAYNFPAHAATALAEVDDDLAGRLRAYFADQARVFDALDRSTSARIAAVRATAIEDGVWEVAYTLSEHDCYGPVDTGDHLVGGRLVIGTEHSARAPALIIGFQPAP